MKLTDFMPHLMVELPGCSMPLVMQTLVRVAHEFCQRTLAWDEMQDPFSLVSGVRDYDLEAPTGAVPFMVRDVWMGNRRLRPVTIAELQQVLPGWQKAASSAPAFYNLAADRATVSLFPTPKGEFVAQVVMRVAYVPANNATSLPDFLGTQYLDAICAGAKSRLMAMPAQTWSQPALVPFYRDQFDRGIDQAKAESLHERVQGTVTAQPRRFI